MRKIAVVVSCNLHWAPYYTRYEKMLSDMKNNYDLILWNREDLKEEVSDNANLIEFCMRDVANNGNYKKIIKFYLFAKFVKRTIHKNKYDKVIFVGTYAFVPALLGRYLQKHLKDSYWIDLRDITYEHNKVFYAMEKRAIEGAHRVVISSKGYLPYLPKRNYGFIHNIDPSMNEIFPQFNKNPSEKIRISYIGNIGYLDSVKKVIDLFANDDRFELMFAGANSEKVRQYGIANQINNIVTFGRFNRIDTVKFYNSTDIVYNVYGDDTINVRTACSNKLYYALKFHLPLLVSKNTYMEEICIQNNIGFVFENTKDFPDKLFEMYSNMRCKEQKYDEVLEESMKEDEKCTSDFEEFINE